MAYIVLLDGDCDWWERDENMGQVDVLSLFITQNFSGGRNKRQIQTGEQIIK